MTKLAILLCALVLLSLCSCHAPPPAAQKTAATPRVRLALLIIPRPKSLILSGPEVRVGLHTRLLLMETHRPLDCMAALAVQSALHEQFGLPTLSITVWHGSVLPPGAIVFGEPSHTPALARLLWSGKQREITRPEGYLLWTPGRTP